MSLAGGIEILVIALLAFVMIGPKELPGVLRALGRGVRTLRQLSADFMSALEGMGEDRPPSEK